MPIRFRCTQCRQLLSVSRRQAGAGVTCPACGSRLRVPTLDGAQGSGTAAPPGAVASERAAPAAADSLAVEEIEPAGAAAPVAASEAKPPAPLEHAGWDAELGSWEEHPAFHRPIRRTIKDEADMTAMVDVTFLLLVFFMITASFSVTKALQSQPPSPEEGTATSAPAPVARDELREESVVVAIAADDSITVDDVAVAGPVELAEVLAAKIENERKTEMVIEAEYRATHGMVVAVTDVGIQAGMQRVRRVARLEQQ